jgi:hypothetical protein
MKTNSQDMRSFWDKIGLGLSGLCLVHCLLLPVAVSSLPWLGIVFEDEWVHLVIAAIAIPVAFIAFIPGFLKHHLKSVLFLGLMGVVLLMLGSIGHDLVGEDTAHWLTICGGVALVSAHIANFKLNSCCSGELCGKHAS